MYTALALFERAVSFILLKFHFLNVLKYNIIP